MTCSKCRKDTENIDPKIEQKIIDQLCNQNVLFMENKRFLKEQEAKGLLSNLGIKTSLRKIPLLNILF